MYFFAEDYIKFIYRLKYYLDQPLVVVTYQESKYKDILIKKGQTHCLVGKLDDVEIVLLHYQDKDDAIEKWNRRVRRVNYDNLIFKMSEMNCCNIRHLCMFDDFSTKKKVLFTSRSYDLQSEIVCNEWAKIGEIKNDTTNFKKHINLVRLING